MKSIAIRSVRVCLRLPKLISIKRVWNCVVHTMDYLDRLSIIVIITYDMMMMMMMMLQHIVKAR